MTEDEKADSWLREINDKPCRICGRQKRLVNREYINHPEHGRISYSIWNCDYCNPPNKERPNV